MKRRSFLALIGLAPLGAAAGLPAVDGSNAKEIATGTKIAARSITVTKAPLVIDWSASPPAPRR